MIAKLVHIVFFISTILVAEVSTTLSYLDHDDFQIENTSEDSSDGEEKDSKEEKEEKRLEDVSIKINFEKSQIENKPILHIQPIIGLVNLDVGSPPPEA